MLSGRPFQRRRSWLWLGFSEPRWLAYRWLLVAALVAIALTFFVVFRIDTQGGLGVSFRTQQTWQSTEWILVRPSVPLRESSGAAGRLASLATIYAQLATTEPVRRLVREGGPIQGRYEVTGPTARRLLPLISIKGLASSPVQARHLAARVSAGLRAYIFHEQLASGVGPSNRVQLHLESTSRTALVHGRRLTVPLAVFGSVMLLLASAALVTWNARRD